MITQQVANYLIKSMTAAVEKPNANSEDATNEYFKTYLERRDTARPQEIIHSDGSIDDGAIVEAFKWRAATLSYQAYQQRIVQRRRWNSLLISLHKLSRAYSESILVSNFFSALQNSPLSEPNRRVMYGLFQLYALHTIDSDARSFQATGALSSTALDALPDRILEIMTEKVRPHAVKLVDSWAIPDYLLDSALGRYDGKVYEELFQKVHRENPLNRVTFNVDWKSDEIVKGDADSEKRILAKL